jgi:catechol 2,3-dioxygenase-like lactoylglutathione lyase family enzyme
MSGIVSIDHVQLAMPVGREDDAQAFYEGVLGVPRVTKPEPLARRGGCWFAHGAVNIHLGAEDPFVPARKAHSAFRVADLDALAATVAAAGYEVRWNDELPDLRRFYTDDPFGNRIELIAA